MTWPRLLIRTPPWPSALGTPGPCLIHAPIDVQEKVYPMVPPGAANKDMIGGEAYVTAHA